MTIDPGFFCGGHTSKLDFCPGLILSPIPPPFLFFRFYSVFQIVLTMATSLDLVSECTGTSAANVSVITLPCCIRSTACIKNLAAACVVFCFNASPSRNWQRKNWSLYIVIHSMRDQPDLCLSFTRSQGHIDLRSFT